MATIFIGGKKFIPEDFIRETGFENMTIRHIGTPINNLPNNKKIRQVSSVSALIYHTNFKDWNEQVDAVIQYLTVNKNRLKKIKQFANIEYANITLAYSLDDKRFLQSFFFPQKLIRICGEFGFSIETTLFNDSLE